MVRHVAQLIRGTTNGSSHHLLFGRYVEHFVTDLKAATGRLDIADHHVLGAQSLPVAIDDLAAAGRHADHVLPRNGLENTGIAQVVADDFRHVLRQYGAALPTEWNDRDRDRTVGTTGDDDVFFLRHRHSRQAAEQDK